MQVWPAGESGITRVGNVLTALYPGPGLNANRIPVEMSVQSIGTIVVQYSYDICRGSVSDRIQAALKIVAGNIEHDARTRGENVCTNRHRHIDRKVTVGRCVGNNLGERLGYRVII